MYLIQSTWSVVIKEEKRNRGDCDAPKVTIKELVFSNIYRYIQIYTDIIHTTVQ